MANMNILKAIPFLKTRQKNPVQVLSNNWSERSSILDDSVNLFEWKRNLDKSVTRYLEGLLAMSPKDIRGIVDTANLSEQLENLRKYWDEAALPTGDEFWNDVRLIAYDFLKFSEKRRGKLHLKVVDNNACSKFHVDGYRLRLFTTYYGPGTEWLPEEAVKRHELGTTNERIISDPNKIRQLGTGHVGILKGILPYRSSTVKGIVHRSPEISQTNLKRIILRIDI